MNKTREQIGDELVALIMAANEIPTVKVWGYPERLDWTVITTLARQWLKTREEE